MWARKLALGTTGMRQNGDNRTVNWHRTTEILHKANFQVIICQSPCSKNVKLVAILRKALCIHLWHTQNRAFRKIHESTYHSIVRWNTGSARGDFMRDHMQISVCEMSKRAGHFTGWTQTLCILAMRIPGNYQVAAWPHAPVQVKQFRHHVLCWDRWPL